MKKVARNLLTGTFIALLLWATTARAQQGFGEVAFANSGPAAAQADFLLGLAQLHDFEYWDAADHFRKAQQIAPDFVMAFWGEAMTQNHAVWHEENLNAGREILNRLAPTPEERLAKARTEREKMYLRSVEVLFGDGAKEERHLKHEAALGELHRKFSDDIDAASFYALAILGTAEKGRDFATYMRAAAVLEEVFPQNSRHPGVVHYLIHSYDDPVHAPLGLRAARIYAKVAPDAAHAQHMTSHIFLAMGMWDDVVKANETAAGVVNRLREKEKRPPVMCGHYNEWLEYGYLQQGRVADARRVLEGCHQMAAKSAEAAATAKDAAPDAMNDMTPAMMAAASYAEMRAHFLIDTQLWNDEVARWTLPAAGNPFAEATFDYTDAIAAIRRGEVAKAREIAARLESELQRSTAWLDQRKMDTSQSLDGAVIYKGELHAMLAAAEGKTQEAMTELQILAAKEHQMPLEFGPPNIEKPTDELLGEILFQLHRPAEARSVFQSELARAPGRRLTVEEFARAEREAGATVAAKQDGKPSSNGKAHKH